MMASPRRPRPWMLLPVATLLLAAIKVLALSSCPCLAWQAPTWHAPTSSQSSSSRISTCSSPKRCGPVPPFMGGRGLGMARQSRTRVAGGDVDRMTMMGDLAGHRAFVDKLLRLTGDPLEQEGGRIVVFRGNPEAQLMLIGEAPGADEDKLGMPFVGRSGQLLDDMLRAVGINPDTEAYICNIVRRRPTDNRPPTPEEMKFYLPMLLEEIELVSPDIIVTLGASPMKALLPFETRGITKARGEFVSDTALAQAHGGALSGMIVMPWFHPSFLLRNGGERSRQEGGVRWHARNDLQNVKVALRRLT